MRFGRPFDSDVLVSAFCVGLASGLLQLNQFIMHSGTKPGTVRQPLGAACRHTGSCAALGTTSVPSTCFQLVRWGSGFCFILHWHERGYQAIELGNCSACHFVIYGVCLHLCPGLKLAVSSHYCSFKQHQFGGAMPESFATVTDREVVAVQV